MRKENILHHIGNTPLVKLNKIIKKKNVEIWLKLEGFNPSGSIKDRVALNIIRAAERKGELTKSKEILEVTSGNMGISLSFIGAVLGYKVTIVMPEDASEERKKLIKIMGANLILTKSCKGEMGARKRAIKICKENKDKYWFADQFSNKNNPNIHFIQTAREIIHDLPDVSHIFTAIGTGGTFLGLLNAFKKYSVNIIGIQPDKKDNIDGLVNFKEEEVSPLLEEKNLAGIVYVKRKDAIKTVKKVVRGEGLFIGISTGAAVYKAIETAEKIKDGKLVVISPDRIEKYFSTDLFLE